MRPSMHITKTKVLLMVSVLLALLVVYLPIYNHHDDTITTSIDSIEMKVSCGNHRAPSCAECPQRQRQVADGCNGQCEWSDDGKVCQSKTLTSKEVGGKGVSESEHTCQPVAHPELRPELVHITKTGGTTLEIIGAMNNVTWGACHWKDALADMESLSCPSDNKPKPPRRSPDGQRYSPGGPIWHAPHKWCHPASKFWLKNATLFTVVRDPYARAVSRWNYYSNRHLIDMVNDATAMNIWLNDIITTMHTNRPVGDSRPDAAYFKGLLIPQTDYITKDVHILRLETLERDFIYMMKGHGYDWVWPKKEFNKSNWPGRHSVANLTSANKALIAKAYRKDFEQLGYPYHRQGDIQQYRVPPKELTPLSKVYLYPSPPNQSPEDLMKCAMKKIPNSLGDKFSVKTKGPGIQDSYLAEDIGEWYLHKQIKGSGVMTTDISEADYFFVNTMSVLSNAVGNCNGMDHNQRQHYWKSILQNSTALKLRPQRHAFICQTWYCSEIVKSLSSLIQKMTYLINEKNTKGVAGSKRFFSSSQILVIPYVAHGDIVPFTEHDPYPRDHKVTFIGSINQRTEWRKPLLTLERSNVHDVGKLRQNFRSSYAEEMMTSTFCLVVSGDTPSSRRLFDAMIAGCIPVFVGLEYVRPFEDIIPYDLFSYRFNGTNYMNGNPQLEVDRLWNISQSEIESKRNIMSQYIKFIDWRHGNSTLEAILAGMKTIST